jgi:hypothetical protein
LLAALHANRIEGSPHHVISHTREVFHATAAEQYQRMLLKVVPFAGNVTGHFDTICETNSGDLAKGRIRLLWRLCEYPHADAPALGALLKGWAFCLAHHRYPSVANQLAYRRQDNSSHYATASRDQHPQRCVAAAAKSLRSRPRSRRLYGRPTWYLDQVDPMSVNASCRRSTANAAIPLQEQRPLDRSGAGIGFPTPPAKTVRDYHRFFASATILSFLPEAWCTCACHATQNLPRFYPSSGSGVGRTSRPSSGRPMRSSGSTKYSISRSSSSSSSESGGGGGGASASMLTYL